MEVKRIKFKLVIAYHGAAYQGWQAQQVGTGVQQKVEEALARLFPSRPRVHGSSRTDTGVHALGLVAHFEVPRAEAILPATKLLLALNAWLPEDVRVLAASRCRADFHARFDARSKQYRYQVWNHPAMNPLLRDRAWHVPRRLDVAAMRRAARLFEGRHDFRSFRANPDYDTDNTVRTLTRCTIARSGPLLTFVIEGDGFLYKMCRGIVGTLVQVGEGKIGVEQIKAILARRDRRVAGVTAPAHGLVLWKVSYASRQRGGQREASAGSAE
ncbi:MAG TPA: tRNA pseudouridine(38-40) synthase TruA [Methylomirabilota bacterium]|nr:tRNA pseudouridine(38-40) synthase TruA [Methylomirabilota bacterium]